MIWILGLEEKIAGLKIIHVAGTKGKPASKVLCCHLGLRDASYCALIRLPAPDICSPIC
ncbi:hypothetical protein CK203_027092 [Vitis vinifera]|uniref:Folylpolyglutamate synthase n=1 Tax=Vitis vinifera TaxID=29760 RepID=A0A438I5Z0_VITVI|nr:hypothetical protein CK203_027092 [Vitis vinifera]